MTILYKTMRADLYQRDKAVETSQYNYGYIAGDVTDKEKVFYETLLAVAEQSGVAFDALTQFSLQVQWRTVSDELLDLFDQGDASISVDLAKFVSVSKESLIEIGLLYALAVAVEECDVEIGRQETGPRMWECLYEAIRAHSFPTAPKRLESFFACKDAESVARYRERHGLGEIVCKIDASGCQTVFEADMTILDNIKPSHNFQHARFEVERYWRQEQSSEPIIEVLLQGKITLLESL